MHYQIELTLANRPAALERVLQVARYRRFDVAQVNLERKTTAHSSLMLDVCSEQSIERLTSQLDKLIDVDSITVWSQLSAAS